MKEKMKLCSAQLRREAHAALHAESENRGVDMAVIMRDLLCKYVAGDVVVESDTSAESYRFYAPPSLIDAVEAKAQAQGYKFGVVAGKLVEQTLLQNK